MAIGIFWLLFVIALASPARLSVYLFFASISFRMLAVIPVNYTGGVTFVPMSLLAPLMAIKLIAATRDAVAVQDLLFNWRKLGLLTATWLVGLAVTATAPVLFAGTSIIELSTVTVAPLEFRSSNLTQILYLTSSCLTVISFCLLLQTVEGRKFLARGLVIGSVVVSLSGLIDMATAGTTALASLRTGTYALLNDNIMGTMRRVIGFCSEASSYGSLTLGFGSAMLCLRPGQLLGGSWRLFDYPIALITLTFALLSTSSGTYVGVATLLLLFLGDYLYRLLTDRSPAARARLQRESIGIGAMILIAAVVIALRWDVVEQVAQMIDETVLQKGASSSYEARAYVTTVSLDAWRATSGYGVGIGSTLASSYPVIVLASLGVVGTTLMLGFLALCFLRRIPRGDPALATLVSGSRYCFVANFIPALGAGTLIDFGPFNALFFAAMAITPFALQPEPWQRVTRLRNPVLARAPIGS